MERSQRRARSKVRRLALANEFRWFVTLTLSPEQIDRYDGDEIVRRLGRWCDNMARRHGLRYILVPARHKDGAFHFHGFFSDAVRVTDSGHTDDHGRKIYNLPQWTLGFTAAMELYGEYPAAVAYVCKYIGKQDGERPLGRWYYSGGALVEPRREYVDMDFREMQERPGAYEVEIPGSRMVIVREYMQKENESNDKTRNIGKNDA